MGATVISSYSIQIQSSGDNTAFAASGSLTATGTQAATFDFPVTTSWVQIPLPTGFASRGKLVIKNKTCPNPVLTALDNAGAQPEDSIPLGEVVVYSNRAALPYIKTTVTAGISKITIAEQ